MDKKIIRKAVGIIGIMLLGLNLAMFSFRVYSGTVFWIVLGIVAVISYGSLRLIK